MNLEKKITSVEVAEMINKDHSKLLRDIRTYHNQLNQSNIGHVEFFNESTYMDAKGETRPCYLVTKKGCEFIGNKLTGIKGTEFTARYIIKFGEMEEKLYTPMSLETMMRIQLQMVDKHENRIEKLENTMTIDYGQQLALKDLVNCVVVEYLGGKGTNAYKEISKAVFSEINKDFQRHFNVNSRNNTPKLMFADAVKYLNNWVPSTNTKLSIIHHNSQMSFA
jgi:Rha family phage regulatory protein